jgi:hypothetical protein
LGPPDWQVPFWQVSFSVHRSPSSQGVPLGAFCVAAHCPVAGLHTFTLHGSVLAGQVFGLPDWQVPFWHVSFSVHRFPSSQAVPFGALTVTQRPLVGSHTLTLHGSVLASQVTAVPGTHTPAWQVSSTVHGFSSSQGVSFATGSQVPVAESHSKHWSQVFTAPGRQVPS